jgi:hypothetical protein
MASVFASRQKISLLIRSLTYKFNHHYHNCGEFHSDDSEACIRSFTEPGQYPSTLFDTLCVHHFAIIYLYLSGDLQFGSLHTKMCSYTKLGDLGNTEFTLDSSATLFYSFGVCFTSGHECKNCLTAV